MVHIPPKTSSAPPKPRVTVLAWKRTSGSSARMGSADVQIGPIEILRCGIVQQEGRPLWVAPPQIEYQRQGDQKKSYLPVIKWPREWSEAIAEAVQQAVADYPEGLAQRPEASPQRPAAQNAQAKTALGQEAQQRTGIGGRA